MSVPSSRGRNGAYIFVVNAGDNNHDLTADILLCVQSLTFPASELVIMQAGHETRRRITEERERRSLVDAAKCLPPSISSADRRCGSKGEVVPVLNYALHHEGLGWEGGRYAFS
jgi:hypothetical protein